jgi:hypothetical protein
MEARDGTMAQITQKINALGSAKNPKDAIAEIDALVDNYVAQSDAIAQHFEQLIQVENAIVEYGGQQRLAYSIARAFTAKQGHSGLQWDGWCARLEE